MNSLNKEEISKEEPVFGNGYSLKYFKVLFILFIPVSFLEIILLFASSILNFAMSGDSASVYDAYLFSKIQMATLGLNIFLIALASLLVLTDKKKLFSWVFLLKYPLVLLGNGLAVLAANAVLPSDPSRITDYLGSIVFFLFFYVPHCFYLLPRIINSKQVENKQH
jgi:hypothetical protein